MKISSHFLLHIQSNFGWDHWKTDFLYSSKESITFYILSHTKNLPAIWETGVRPLGQREIPWRREWQPTPVFLPGESHRQRSLAGYNPWGRNELDTTEWLTLSHTSYTFICMLAYIYIYTYLTVYYAFYVLCYLWFYILINLYMHVCSNSIDPQNNF